MFAAMPSLSRWHCYSHASLLDRQNRSPRSDKAVIRGTVTDQTQAVVIGATVVLSDNAGVEAATQTNDKGIYSFTDVAARDYYLLIYCPRFRDEGLR